MIITSLNNPLNEVYKKTHPRFEKAFAALKELAAQNLEDSRFEIDGRDIHVIVTSYDSQPAKERNFEIHHEYIDIQYIVKGKELIGYESIDKLENLNTPGNEIEFFGLNEDFDTIRLEAGECVIIFPEEPHAPNIAVDDIPESVQKIVVKVRMK